MRPSWFKISGILAGLWLVIASLLWWLAELRPSPEKLVAFAMAHRVAGQPEAQRASAVGAVAEEYHRLDVGDQGTLLTSKELEPWWKELTKPERLQFRLLLFPKTMQVVDFFDKFSPEQRMTNMQKLMRDVRRRGGDDMLPEISTTSMNMVRLFGLKAFIQSPMMDDKIESLLVFYELERRLVWTRR